MLLLLWLQAILNTHPYHVDSLLQLSEICKMGEDYQMAAELIGQCYNVLFVFLLLSNNPSVSQKRLKIVLHAHEL